ncbi:hypothetical protein EDC01DRAFT_626139 [Geopyxis carbonaria]|nr:hypothetical protein EDC01DRAFT_626139 [Geopyxis carbonaria]
MDIDMMWHEDSEDQHVASTNQVEIVTTTQRHGDALDSIRSGLSLEEEDSLLNDATRIEADKSLHGNNVDTTMYDDLESICSEDDGTFGGIKQYTMKCPDKLKPLSGGYFCVTTLHNADVHYVSQSDSSPTPSLRENLDDLHREQFIDFVREEESCKNLLNDPAVTLHLEYDIDYLSISGIPLLPLTPEKTECLSLMDFRLSLGLWHREFDKKRSTDFDFELSGRTFYLGAAAGRIKWYLVFEPSGPLEGEDECANEDGTSSTWTRKQSAMSFIRAKVLSSYIISTFHCEELVDTGVDPNFKFPGSYSKHYSIPHEKWCLFQRIFMDGWVEHSQSLKRGDVWWAWNHPTFHMIDFGQKSIIFSDPRLDKLEIATNIGKMLDSICPLTNVRSVRYALAVTMRLKRNIMYKEQTSTTLPGYSSNMQSYSILGNRLELEGFFEVARGIKNGFTFYPLGFNRQVGNLQATCQPWELCDGIWNNIKEDMVTPEALKPGSIQMYWEAQHLFRPTVPQFLLAKNWYQAYLCPGLADKPLMKTHAYSYGCKNTDPVLQYSRPFRREIERIQTAADQHKTGFRIEPVVTLQMGMIDDSRKSWRIVAEETFLPQIEWWDTNSETFLENYTSIFKVDVFPRVIISHLTRSARILEGMRLHVHNDCDSGDRQQELSLAGCELVASLERSGAYCLTGDPRCLDVLLQAPLGVSTSIESRGILIFNKKLLDCSTMRLQPCLWPAKHGMKIMSHISAMQFHYSPQMALSRRVRLHFHTFLLQDIKMDIQNCDAIEEAIQFVVKDVMVPELLQWTAQQLDKYLIKHGIGTQYNKQLLYKWKNTSHPFKNDGFPKLLSIIAPNYTDKEFQVGNPAAIDLHTLSWHILKAKSGIEHIGSSWPSAIKELCSAIVHKDEENKLSPSDFVAILQDTLHRQKIDWLPGRSGGKLCGHVAVQIQQVIVRKRKAPDLDNDQYGLPFGIPMGSLPTILVTGLQRLSQLSISSSDLEFRKHIQHAERLLTNDKASLTLACMLLSIVGMCQPPPVFNQINGTKGCWTILGVKQNKHKQQWYAVLVIKFLYILYPNSMFTLNRPLKFLDAVGQHKASFRMLLELGLCRRKNSAGTRFSVRLDEVQALSENSYQARLTNLEEVLRNGEFENVVQKILPGCEEAQRSILAEGRRLYMAHGGYTEEEMNDYL